MMIASPIFVYVSRIVVNFNHIFPAHSVREVRLKRQAIMEEYVVEAIVGERRVKRRGRSVVQYKVKWEGYADPTWEPMSNLKNCKDELDAYKVSKMGAQSKSNTEMATQDQMCEQGDTAIGIGAQDTMASAEGVGSDEGEEADEGASVGGEEGGGAVEDNDVDEGDERNEQEDGDDKGEKASECDDRHSDYEVEAIVGEKRFKAPSGGSILKYQVKWGGYDELSWEPLANLKNCMDKVEAFRAGKKFVSVDESPVEDDFEFNFGEHGDDDDDDDDYEGSQVESETEEGKREETSEEETKREDEEERPRARARVSTPRARVQAPTALRKRTRDPPPRPTSAQKNRPSLAFLDSEEEGSRNEDEDGSMDDKSSDEEDETIVEVGEQSSETEDESIIADIAGANVDLSKDALRELGLKGYVDTYYGDDPTKYYEATDMCTAEPRLSTEAQEAAKSLKPIDVFFFFLPKKLWRDLAIETNRYESQTRNDRYEKAKIRTNKLPARLAETYLARERKRIAGFDKVKPVEILHVLGLLIARSLNPTRLGIEKHWTSVSRGAIPAGSWSTYMPRQRFREILRFLHFSDNEDPRAKQDRAWKIRPVIETLQERFATGMTLGKWIAFDEMVIPSRSSRNGIRIYLKNKPHKYGTKLFAVCCGKTKYCSRIDVYCGARQSAKYVDTLAGPAAVIRNLQALWPPHTVDRTQKRVVITDREYTCLGLSARLLGMGFYHIGTVQPSRLGFPRALKYPFKNVPKKFIDQRGLCRLKRCLKYKDIFACSWLDNKPVYFLSSGVCTKKTAIRRKLKNGASTQVPCPEFIDSYNQYMSGVDTHDQLRLQRYSVQRSLRLAKYYKMLFLGLVDMGLVNAYIVHREYCKSKGLKPLTHGNFRVALHEQLLELTPPQLSDSRPRNVAGECVIQSPGYTATVTNHTIVASNDKKPSGGTRFRVCKVCSLLRQNPTDSIPTTKWYCKECSNEKSRIFLCNSVQRDDVGNQLTCFQTWHQLWNNGTCRWDGNSIRRRQIEPDEATSQIQPDEATNETGVTDEGSEVTLSPYTPSSHAYPSPAFY